MRPWLSILLLLFLGQCLSGSTPGPPARVRPLRLVIASTPVPLDSSDPARSRLGALTYLGGWQLTSDSRAFGGLSALDVDGNHVTAVSDIGAIVRFRLGRFGSAGGADLLPIPRGCGPVAAKTDNDTESLAHDPGRTSWWIGMEYRNIICRTDSAFARGRFAKPAAMADWPKKRGPESLLMLNDGRIMAIAEGSDALGPLRPVLIFAGDPALPGTATTRLDYRPPPGFDPTDAIQLPDGRLVILNRRFALPSLFTANIVVIDRPDLRAGSVLGGRVVATFAPPVIADNFEGLSATREQGRTILWVVSDDNYMRWQRTLLLKLALD